MGIGGGLAAHGAQAEALAFIEARGFQLAIVPDQAFGLALLDEEFAVFGPLERLADEAFHPGAAEIFGLERGNGGNGAHGDYLCMGSVGSQDR